jgi:hypothetical protein
MSEDTLALPRGISVVYCLPSADGARSPKVGSLHLDHVIVRIEDRDSRAVSGCISQQNSKNKYRRHLSGPDRLVPLEQASENHRAPSAD